MQKTKILREIIETLEKHDSEFTVEKFNSDIIQCGAEQELISFNIKFDLKQKETAAVPEVPTAEIFPAGPGPKEENQSEEPVPGEELKTNPADIALDEEVSEILEPCCEEEELPKKKAVDKKKCVDCVNCYNDNKVDKLKCCKGNKKIISEYTCATFCDDYQAKQ